MFEYTIPEIVGQIRSLPIGLFAWLRVLAVLNLCSVLLIRRTQARWVLVALLFIFATNMPIFLSFGLVKLASIPHFLVWIPLVVYLAKQLRSGQVDVHKPFGLWCFAVMLVDLVSVVFDLRDGAQYLLGDRSPLPNNLSASLPVPTLVVIAGATVVAAGYALGFPRDRAGGVVK